MFPHYSPKFWAFIWPDFCHWRKTFILFETWGALSFLSFNIKDKLIHWLWSSNPLQRGYRDRFLVLFVSLKNKGHIALLLIIPYKRLIYCIPVSSYAIYSFLLILFSKCRETIIYYTKKSRKFSCWDLIRNIFKMYRVTHKKREESKRL